MTAARAGASTATASEEAREAEEVGASPRIALEDFVPDLTAPAVSPSASSKVDAAPVLRAARIVGLEGRKAQIAWRGRAEAIAADIAPELERELLVSALAQRDSVLVEHTAGGVPLVIGVVQTRVARELVLKAEVVRVEAEREILLRVGTAALRLREDGDIELVGSRISAASRGLFRLVGRILRLN